MAAKKCLICNCSFRGRADARTCSPRCRKRLQLVRSELAGRPAAPGRRDWRQATRKSALLILLGLSSLLGLVFSSSPPRAQALTAASNLNFQARLLNAGGAVVPDGNYNIDFKVYNADSTTGTVGTCSGSCLWEETRKNFNSQGVAVTNGYFSVNLGSVTSFPSTINWDQQLYLTMNIGGTSAGASPTWDGEMQNAGHSIALTSVPLAFRANQLAVAGTNEQVLQFASSTFGQATTISLPDPGAGTATVCYQNAAACGFASSSGSGSYIQNSTSLQSGASFNIQPSSGNIAAQFRANGSGDLIQLQNSSGQILSKFNNNGDLLIGGTNSSASATAFRVQDTSGVNLLTADTTADKISIGNGTSQFEYNSWAGARLEIADGTNASPITIAGPTVKISRTDGTATATCGGNQVDSECNAALKVAAIGISTVQMQTNGIDVSAQNSSTVAGADAFGLLAHGRVTGSGVNIGGGAYIEGRRDTNTGRITGAEITSWNYTNTDCTYTSAAHAGCVATWIVSRGLSGSKNSAAIQVDDGAGSQFVTGIGFNTGSIATTTFDDASSSTTSIHISSSHTTGIDLHDGTFSSAPILLGNTSPIRIQNAANNSALNVMYVNSSDQLILGTDTAILLNNNTTVKTNKSFTAQGTATFQDATNSATAFQVLNSTGTSAFVVDTTPLNSNVVNPSIEASISGNWSAKGTGVSASQTSSQHFIGFNALSVTTNGAANDGAKQTLGATLSGTTTYSISFYIKRDATSFNPSASYSDDGTFGGGTEHACSSYNTQTVSSSGWTRISCTFTTGASPNSSNAIAIFDGAATASHTFYIDAVQIVSGATSQPFKENGVAVNSLINSPLLAQNTTDSTTAFQVQNAAGSFMFNVDTLNNRVGIGTATPTTTLDVWAANTTQAKFNSTGSNRASISINNNTTGQQAVVNFQDAGTDKFQIGKQNDNTFLLFDVANNRSLITTDSSGNLQLQPNSGNTILGNSSASTTVAIQSGGGGTISVGNNAASQTITIGNGTGTTSVAVQCGSGTCGFGNNAADHTTVLGSSTGVSTTNVQSGTGNITLTTNGSSASVIAKSGVNSTTAFQVQKADTTTLLNVNTSSPSITLGANTLGNASATATTATTSGTGTNTTTVALTAVNSLANGDVIFIDNAGQDYFTRITAGGGTTSLTVDPAVTYENARTVTKYNVQYLGSDGTNFSGATRNQNSFYQGYFLGGVVTGAGSTVYSDANIQSAGNLRINTATGVNIQGTNAAAAFQVSNSSANSVITIDTSANQAILGKASSLNGTLVFANNAGANTVSIVAQASNPASSVTIQLPTVGASGSGQCVLSDTGSTTTNSLLKFSTCPAGSTSQTKVVAMGSPAGCTGSVPVASQDTNADYVVNSCTSAQTTINTAISAISSTGGTIYLKEGTYIVDGSINLAANVTLMGSGTGTILKLKDSTNTAINVISGSSINNIAVKNLILDGNRTNNSSGAEVGINISSSGSGSGTSAVIGYTLSDLTVKNFLSSGLTLSGSNDYIKNASIINNGGYAIGFTSSSNVLIANSNISGSGNQGIDCFSLSNSTITNNMFQGNASEGGIKLATGTGNTISGNTFITNSGAGIKVLSTGNTVTGNTFTSNSGDGIYIQASNNTISGNTANSNTGHGIEVFASGDSITGNRTLSNSSDGIEISGSSNQVTGNTTSGNSGWGIEVTGNTNAIDGNTSTSNTNDGIKLNLGSNQNIISGNQINANGGNGVMLDVSSQNQITNNRIHNNGGDGIQISAGCCGTPDKNSITDNNITDTAGATFAIDIFGTPTPTNTYIANNIYSGTGASSINDTSTSTIYANQLTATGGLQNKVGTDSTAAFQIQNSAGSSALNIDTSTNTNIVSNGSAETGTTGWAALGSASLAQSAAQQYVGVRSLAITTTAAANDGAKYPLTTTTLASNTKYTLSLAARLNYGQSMSTLEIGRAENGSTFTSCLTAQSINGNGWTNFTCTFTTGTTSSTPFIYIRQTDATARTVYIDAVQLTRFSLLTNASVEQAIAGNWAVKGSSTVTQDATQFADGANSLKIVTTAANNDGAKQNITLNDSTQYTVTFQAINTGAAFATMEAGYSSDGSTDNTVCITAQTVGAGWTSFTCTFTTPSSHSGSPYFYIKQTNNVVHTFYVDIVQVVQGNPASSYREGIISLNDIIGSPLILQNQSNSTTAFQVQNSGGTGLLSVDSTNSYVQVGSAITDATAVLNILDSYNNGTDPTGVNGAMYYNTNLNAFRCYTNGTWANCNASATTLSQTYTNGSSAGDQTINLTSGDGGGVIIKDSSGGLGTSLFSVQSNSGTKYLDVTASKITIGANTVGNATSTATTATTSGTGTNTTTVTLTAVNSLANGDVIFIDNAGQDYFTRITAGGGTTSLTVDPAVTYENTRTVTKYNAQYLGSDGTNFSGATRNQNSFYQGYFLGGVVTGAGSTVYSDANISSVGNLRINAATGVNIQGINSTSAFTIQDSSGNSVLNADSTNRYVGINNAAPNATLDVQASSNTFFDGFETGALSPFVNVQGWSALNGTTHTGSWSAKNNNATGDSLTLTKTLNSAGTISFWLKVTESAFQRANFYVDGVSKVAFDTTTQPYTFYSFAVASGAHTFTWANTDPAGSNGGQLWLDDVSLTNAGVGNAALFNGGNVGIGTAFPTASLEVDGTGLFKSVTNSTSAFQIQNASGSIALAVDTGTNTNIISNGSLETGTTGWAAVGSATLAQSTAQQYVGTDSLNVATTAAANDGAKFPLTTTTLASNTKYTLTLAARLPIGQSMSTLEIGRAENGSTFTSCLTGQTLSSSGWTTFTCTFTTGSTSSTPFIYVRQTDATARNIYIDAIQLTRFSLLTNASIEQAIAGNWAVKGSAAVTQDATQFSDGTKSLKIVTTAANNDGAKQAITLNDSTFYTVSFQALNTGAAFATMEAGYSSDGTTDNTPCMTAQTVTGSWTNFTCTFTTPGFHSGTPYFYIKQTNNVVHTFYVDAVQLVQGNPVSAYREGIISLNDVINSPAVFQNQANSTTAFQIQTSVGVNVVNVDTSNKALSVSGGATYSTISYSVGSGFASHVDYTVGSGPGLPAVADFNGDSKKDLAVPNGSSGTISILLGNGDGTFGAKSDISVGGAPKQVIASDFNGDGNQDLGVANDTGCCNAYFQVLLGNGDGTFAAYTSYSVNSDDAIQAGDFNGDGKPDIAVANHANDNILVYLNSGTGTFTFNNSYATGSRPLHLTIADFNGDGKKDIVSANNSSNTVSFFAGNGDGTFVAKVDTAMASNTYDIGSGDFNGDGKIDIALESNINNNVSVQLGNGDGTFGAPATYTTGGNAPQAIITADFTGDGKPDIAVTDQAANAVLVFNNTGTGTFSAFSSYTVGSSPFGLAAGDFNGDTTLDIAASNSGTTTESILLNGATPSTTVHNGTINLTTSSAATTGLIIQASASQTDDLMRIQDSSGSAYLEVTSDGLLKVNTLDSLSGNLTIGASSTAVILGNNTRVAAHNSFSALGASLFQDATNSATAFQIQDSGGTNLLAVNTSSRIVTISGDATTFGNLTLTNAHFKSTQTTAPTIGTPTNCATSPTAAVGTGSTDSAGSFRITSGTGGGQTTCDTVITFNKAYGAAPKSIVVIAETKDGGTGTAAARQIYVSAAGTTTFTVKMNSAPAGASEVNWFYYWVVE